MSGHALRLDRKPRVKVSITPQGVSLTLQAVIQGDGQDWSADDASDFLVHLWEAARQTAHLHRLFGFEPAGIPADDIIPPAVQPPTEPPMPVRSIVTVPRPDLDALIARGEQNGSLVVSQPKPYKRTSPGAVRREQQRVLAYLAGQPDQEASRKKLNSHLADMNTDAIRVRLESMKVAGLIRFRAAPGPVNFGFWGLTEKGRRALQDREPEIPADHPLAQVLPHTTGKTLLMLGGQPDLHHMRAVEEALHCRLRWPVIPEQVQCGLMPQIRQQIEKPDVDYVLVNRFNRRASREYGHIARDAGKPVIVVANGLNPVQIAEQFRLQYVDRLDDLRRAA